MVSETYLSYHLKVRSSCVLNPNVSQSLRTRAHREALQISSGLNINKCRAEHCAFAMPAIQFIKYYKVHLYLFPGHLLEPPGQAFNIVTHSSPSHVPR